MFLKYKKSNSLEKREEEEEEKNSREFLWFFCVKMVALVWLHSVTPLMSF